MEILRPWITKSLSKSNMSSGFWGSLMALLLFIPLNLHAQHYEKDHIGFHVTSFLYQKADIVFESGNFPVKTKPAFGFEFGGSYTFNINKRVGIKTSLIVGLRTTNYNYQLSRDEYQLHYDLDFRSSSMMNFYTQLALMFVYRFPINERNAMGFETGGALKLYNPAYMLSTVSQYDSAFSNSIAISVLEIDISGSSPSVAFDFQFKPFWHILLKNHRIVHLGLLVNIPVSKHPYDGMFYFLSNSQQSGRASFDIRNGAIGLEFGYILTRVPNPKRQKRRHPSMSDTVY